LRRGVSQGTFRHRMAAPGTRVLLVDDNDDARDLLGGLLELQGFQIESAADAPGALAIAARWQPQIVVLDLGLPDIDGWDLARQLRQVAGLERVRIIALTGYGSERDRERSREAGIDVHLLKPIEIAKLVEMF
jgi:CheY-like chemotaxis protein